MKDRSKMEILKKWLSISYLSSEIIGSKDTFGCRAILYLGLGPTIKTGKVNRVKTQAQNIEGFHLANNKSSPLDRCVLKVAKIEETMLKIQKWSSKNLPHLWKMNFKERENPTFTSVNHFLRK